MSVYRINDDALRMCNFNTNTMELVRVNNESKIRRENVPRKIKYDIKTDTFYTTVNKNKIPVFCAILPGDTNITIYSKPNNDKNIAWSKHNYTYNEKSIAIVRQFFSLIKDGDEFYGIRKHNMFIPNNLITKYNDYRRTNDAANKQ